MKYTRHVGQVALPFILLVSGIIVEIAIAGSFVSYFLSNSEAGERLAVRALSAAQSGSRDAAFRISTNKEFAASATSSYSFPVGQDSVSVTVSRVVDTGASIYMYTVTTLGTAGSRQKKIRSTYSVHQVSGQIQILSTQEVPVQ